MTSAELKAQHPETHAEIHAAGVAAGTHAEQERVKAWNVFSVVDQEAVNKGIASGKAITTAESLEFMLKANSTDKLKALKDASAANLLPTPADNEAPTPEALEKQKEIDALFGQFKKS